MSSDQSPARPVGRGAKVRAAVHAAALAELVDVGYAALTVESVAQRAGVHKTTVYRRWKDRESLLTDALAEHMAADIPVPDTGAIGGDLRALARSLVQAFTSPTGQAVLAAMFTGAAHLPEIAAARRHVFGDRLARAEPVVLRAVERGELPAGTDAAELLRTLAAPIYLRLLMTGDPVDESVADRAAHVALAAARAGALSAPAGP
ncbi:AcrR family transcriptional regulator [Nonomuraea thailandensis]|uniref:AcrR family transcriptional regulator n=1 Tax=Nonomuraea thailandensis TaxID=1188745 RepID=A0A9X2GHH2_9ACTN|nr:TetR/AcrR family transcriptional regulator [Nonomuraea thailandensis]MCP2357604.1 AcrR family transcriptional regulator [Nonomuraea thailandensis]